MKKNGLFNKNLLLTLGTISLTTLPFVSVVSCSSSSSQSPNEKPGTDSDPDQKPQEIPYLNKTWDIRPINYEDNRFVVSPTLFYGNDLNEIKNMIDNNQVKVKNDDGTYVKYEVTVTLNPGVTFANNLDVNPYKEYNSDTNQFKILNKDEKITTSFEIDFNPKGNKEIIGFLDIKNTIAVTNTDITNDKDVRVDSLAFVFFRDDYRIALTHRYHEEPEIFIENKDLFSKVDTPELKYADWTNYEEGKKGKLFLNRLMGTMTNISGTISIKPIESQ